jgi:hypothetical protein
MIEPCARCAHKHGEVGRDSWSSRRRVGVWRPATDWPVGCADGAGRNAEVGEEHCNRQRGAGGSMGRAPGG